jgi:uncharacterized cofD-like protein
VSAPRIVAIGGGTGLSVLLRGLKEHTPNVTAIVSVADDGGSSGRLRQALGVPPMGDIRRCIAALADAEPVMQRLLQYRFAGNGETAGAASAADALEGHALGNLLIAALTDIEGDFEEGVRQVNRVLNVRGRVVPAARTPVTLHAELTGGRRINGQSLIARTAGIERLWIEPADVRPSADALAAIAQADLVLYGPGSLFTSLLPTLLMADARAALEASDAPRVFVCNVATQVGETEGYGLSDHLAAFRRHGLLALVDAVLANSSMAARQPTSDYPAQPVRPEAPKGTDVPRVILRDVVDDDNAHYHDPAKLAAELMALLESGAFSRRRVGNR